MVVTKPVSRFHIWFGKWLGLVILNAALLCLSGATVYGLLRWNTRPSTLDKEEVQQLEEEILVARKQISPQIPDVEKEARQMAEQWMKSKDVPAEASMDEAMGLARKMILANFFSVAPGATHTWDFELPGHVQEDRPLQVRYKFATSRMEVTAMQGTWTVGGPDAPRQSRADRNDMAEGFHTLRVQDHVASPDGSLQVSFKNTNIQRPVTIYFPPQDGISVFVYVGGFAGNLTRALLVLLLHLSFLAAVGVTAGSLLSLPTATFTALYFVVLLKFIPYIETMASRESFAGGPGQKGNMVMDVFLLLFYQGMNLLVAPLKSANPLDALGIGELVPWSWVGAMFLIKVVIYGGAIALIGQWLFNRRELGLPS